MDVKQLNQLKRFAIEGAQKVQLHESTNIRTQILCLEPGQTEAPHTHDGVDKVYYVLEGRATASVAGETRAVGPGDAVLAPPGVPHGISNDGTERFLALVVAAPNPHV